MHNPIETLDLWSPTPKFLWTDAKRGPAILSLQFPEFSHVSFRVFYIHISPTSDTSAWCHSGAMMVLKRRYHTGKQYEIYLAAKDTKTYPYGDS